MFKLIIETKGDAFSDPGVEITRILRDLPTRECIQPGDEGRLFDINGNTCGIWMFA